MSAGGAVEVRSLPESGSRTPRGPGDPLGILGPGLHRQRVRHGRGGRTASSVVAVGLAQRDRARAFAEKHGVPRSYGSYEELVGDGGVGRGLHRVAALRAP